jgi:hypothetical protein
MAIAEYTPIARLRGRPSGKVTAISDSAVGAGGDQPGLAGGQPAEQRGEREHEQPGDEDPAASQQVAGPAAEQQQPAERHRVGVHHPLQVRPGKAERGLDVRQRDHDDGQVEHDHQLRRGDDGQHQARPPRRPGSGRGPGLPGGGPGVWYSSGHDDLLLRCRLAGLGPGCRPAA